MFGVGWFLLETLSKSGKNYEVGWMRLNISMIIVVSSQTQPTHNGWQ
jgi:hypothetical protein